MLEGRASTSLNSGIGSGTSSGLGSVVCFAERRSESQRGGCCVHRADKELEEPSKLDPAPKSTSASKKELALLLYLCSLGKMGSLIC